MGATVFKQAKAYSFPTNEGPVGYVWLEETYDKKDGPQQARWSVTAIGHREQMIDRIFSLAGSIPGGTLHIKHASALAFINAMKKNLDQPEKLTYTTLRLANSHNGFNDAIVDKNRSAVQALFLEHGKEDEARLIDRAVQEGGHNIVIDMANDMELVKALQKRDPETGESLASPWKLLKNHGQKPVGDGAGPVDTGHLTRATQRPLDIQVLQTGVDDGYQNNRLCLCMIDGEPFGLGDLWSIEARLIERAGKMEHSAPGYYKAALKGLQVAAENVEQLHDGVIFKLDGTKAGSAWQRDLSAICEKITGQPGLKIELTLPQVKSAFENQPEDARHALKYHLSSLLADPKITTVEKLLLQEAEPEQTQVFERARG